MKNKKTFGILSLVLSIVSLFALVLAPDDISVAEILVVVFFLIAIASVVFGFIGKKDAKGLSIAGIVIGIISFVLLGLALLGFYGIKNCTDCVSNGDGTATCDYMGTELKAPIRYLRQDQMR